MGNLKVGAVVVLNSGGPAMTIKWIDNDEAYCQWFAGEKVSGDIFPVLSLKTKE